MASWRTSSFGRDYKVFYAFRQLQAISEINQIYMYAGLVVHRICVRTYLLRLHIVVKQIPLPMLSPFSTRRICSRDAKRKQEFSNVIGWRKSLLLRQPITLPDSCFRFASREQIRLVENGL